MLVPASAGWRYAARTHTGRHHGGHQPDRPGECPAHSLGLDRDPRFLNEGAGGEYVYFAYEGTVLIAPSPASASFSARSSRRLPATRRSRSTWTRARAGSTSTPRSPAGPATLSRTSPSSPPATWSQPAQRVPTDRRGPQQGRRRKVHLLLLPHLTDATGPGTGSGRQKGSSTCLRRGAGGRLVPPDPVRPVPVRSRALGSAGRDEPGPGQYRSGRTTRRCGYESLAGQSEPRPFAVARKFWITASWSPAVAAEPYCTSSVFRWYAQCVPMAESR